LIPTSCSLFSEDNKEALFVYEKYLKGTRFQVVPATSLKEARNALREFRPTAVILDVLLQGEHSWELLQDIKQNPDTRTIPLFVVTVVDNRDKALALGSDGFHPKPIERTWLIGELERIYNKPTRRVLIVEDHEVSRYIVRTAMETRTSR
jgi:CheY-like chemotaxis protein